MASSSFSVQRGVGLDALASGSSAVTEGTAAPGAGDLEVRINNAQGWTRNEIEIALDQIWRFLSDSLVSTSNPL